MLPILNGGLKDGEIDTFEISSLWECCIDDLPVNNVGLKTVITSSTCYSI